MPSNSQAYSKQYYLTNKSKWQAYHKRTVMCEACHKLIRHSSLSRHNKGKRHLNNVVVQATGATSSEEALYQLLKQRLGK